jgi:outer membrane lipoprotein-sorting protein
MKSVIKKILLALVLALVLAQSAWAITLEQAARQAARQHNAKVLSARTVQRGQQRVHEIKVLTKQGVVKTVRVPAPAEKGRPRR